MPFNNCMMKSIRAYSFWRFWPLSLPIQFHALLFVLIAVFHKNTPNTGCPVLGVHIIISEEWDHMVWLPWKELSRVATLPYFRMLRPSKFRRSEFGGVWWERRALLFDMKPSLISPLPIKSCTIFEHFNLDTVISILRGFHLHSSLWPADSSAPWSSDCLGSTLLPVALSVCIEVGLTSFSSSCRIIPPSLCNLWKKIATHFIQ